MVVDIRGQLLLVDPTTQPTIAEFNGAPRLRDLSNKRVGLIDDSKVNAKELRRSLGNFRVRREIAIDLQRKCVGRDEVRPIVIGATTRVDIVSTILPKESASTTFLKSPQTMSSNPLTMFA